MVAQPKTGDVTKGTVSQCHRDTMRHSWGQKWGHNQGYGVTVLWGHNETAGDKNGDANQGHKN